MKRILKLLSLLVYVRHTIASIQQTQIVFDQEFKASSKAVHDLISASVGPPRHLDYDSDTSFIASYSIKFQGCTHMTQYNGSYEDGDNLIVNRKLVRFRLCPTSSCSNGQDSGCSHKYGDYIVDINTFLYYYLTAQKEENEAICMIYWETCYSKCQGNSNSDCMNSCYQSYGATSCDEGDDDFDASKYSSCAAFEQFGDGYYIGPYCSEKGNAIYLGLFSDDDCSVSSSCDSSCYYSKTGKYLPYSTKSLVSWNCVSCSDDDYQDGYADPRGECLAIYNTAGKCETKLYIDYPNESACDFIDGIKHVRGDGVLKSHSGKRSKAAGALIGLFTTSTVLLGYYSHHLHKKLTRARVKLSPNEAELI